MDPHTDATDAGPLVNRALKIAATLQICALALIPFVASLLTFLMGDEYRPAATAMVPLLLAVLPLCSDSHHGSRDAGDR